MPAKEKSWEIFGARIHKLCTLSHHMLFHTLTRLNLPTELTLEGYADFSVISLALNYLSP